MAIYTRPEPRFEEVFGRSGRETIASMDAAGDDIAYQKPRHKLTLTSAGVSRSNVPVLVTDPFDSSSQTHISCDVTVLTEVPATKRGIHLSRISDAIARLSERTFASLQGYASALAERVRSGQYGGRTSARVSGLYSYYERVPGRTPDKDKLSLESIGLRAGSFHSPGEHAESAGLVFTNITACPCVQQTLKHASPQGVGELPTLTHSQRCETSLNVERIGGGLPVRDLLEAIDRVVVRTRNTLPREYEALLVHRAHQKPQFMEDVVRQVLFCGYEQLKERFPDSSLRVTSRCMESIHAFDITCELEYSIRDLKDISASLR
ncbi:MAG TPA: GTP cyclohydrolase, FolE2/MptA family [Blastocatellia bacterium]|nr:GTP cyclohydrolase, FolE2/MptA family [Blastocatellia bacterium]